MRTAYEGRVPIRIEAPSYLPTWRPTFLKDVDFNTRQGAVLLLGGVFLLYYVLRK